MLYNTMQYLTINKKPFFIYDTNEFILNKWYVFTDNGGEGNFRDGPYNTKKDATLGFCSPIHRYTSKGIYRCNRAYIMTGKTAIKHGFNEWCYEVNE